MLLSALTRSALTAMIPATLLVAACLVPAPDTSSGFIRSDSTRADLWVNAATGSDANDGTTAGAAFRTIQAAAGKAAPGTVIHIQPGIYRESIAPATDGTGASPIIFRAEAGPGTVFVRGSVPAGSLPWTRLQSNEIGLPATVDPSNIYYADLSGWGLKQPPRFLVELDGAGQVASRLMPAREPDLHADADWKDTEFWWMANGGSAVASCDPTTDPDRQCDLPSRSFTQLTDPESDSAPAGIEPGNLTTLGDLTGGTLVAMDAQHAHYVYRRSIVATDIAAGRITVDENCDNDGTGGLGWGSKYYVENRPALLDQPGEWWFDAETGRLYLWPPQPKNPAELNLEISHLDTGFDLTGRSYIALDGLTVELFNGAAYKIWNEDPYAKAFGNAIRNSALHYANQGVVLYQYMNQRTPPAYAIDGMTVEDSEIAYMDTSGIDSSFWWPGAQAADQFDHSGVRNLVIRNNNLHHLGFNSDARSAVGVRVFFPDQLRFEGNHLHDIAHAGVHFHLSLIDSPKQYGFSPQEIKLGGILVANNLFERTCLRASDCGALKFGGSNRPATHVFRDVLITGNVFRNTIGWSYVSTLRKIAQDGDGNGLYLDYASGIHAYRNIAYNNTGAGFKLSCLWRDGDIVLYNNIAANNGAYGIKFTGQGSCDNHAGSVNTQVANNIFVNNGADGIELESDYETGNFGTLVIDHNLYYRNGWSAQAGDQGSAQILLLQGSKPRQLSGNLDQLRASLQWETHGVEGDPAFVSYNPADHDLFDGSSPDFHLTANSLNAVDRGTADLPASLASLLAAFEISDTRRGAAFDIGRYESEPPALRSTAAIATATAQAARSTSPWCTSPAAFLLIGPAFILAWRRGTHRKAAGLPSPARDQKTTSTEGQV